MDGKLVDAYEFVDSMVPRADGDIIGAPYWHGWALREASLTGFNHCKGERVRNPLSLLAIVVLMGGLIGLVSGLLAANYAEHARHAESLRAVEVLNPAPATPEPKLRICTPACPCEPGCGCAGECHCGEK
jgi:hypothetical protein